MLDFWLYVFILEWCSQMTNKEEQFSNKDNVSLVINNYIDVLMKQKADLEKYLLSLRIRMEQIEGKLMTLENYMMCSVEKKTEIPDMKRSFDGLENDNHKGTVKKAGRPKKLTKEQMIKKFEKSLQPGERLVYVPET